MRTDYRRRYPVVEWTDMMVDAQDTVLIVDDDLGILRILRKGLGDHYRVIEAHNGLEALEVVEAERPACVVLDVMMPEMNGWEVARHLRKNTEYDSVGILMVTAIGETLNELTSPLYGADDQIDKPFELKEVLSKVAEVIAQRKS